MQGLPSGIGGLGVARFQSVPVPAVVRDAVQSHTSTLGLAAALGVAGLFGLVIFTRRRSPRRMAPAVIQSRPMIFEKPQENLHPLFTTQRTVRDNSFVFKKTRKKGRLYRNRAGEKVLHKPDD